MKYKVTNIKGYKMLLYSKPWTQGGRQSSCLSKFSFKALFLHEKPHWNLILKKSIFSFNNFLSSWNTLHKLFCYHNNKLFWNCYQFWPHWYPSTFGLLKIVYWLVIFKCLTSQYLWASKRVKNPIDDWLGIPFSSV